MPSGANGPVRGTTTPILIGPEPDSVPPSAELHAAKPRAPARVRVASLVLFMVTSEGRAEAAELSGFLSSGFLKMEYDHAHMGCQGSLNYC